MPGPWTHASGETRRPMWLGRLGRLGLGLPLLACAPGPGPGLDGAAEEATETSGAGTRADLGETIGSEDTEASEETAATADTEASEETADTEASADTGGCPPDCPLLPPEAGFVTLPVANYELGLAPETQAMTSTTAQMFWALQYADEAADEAPIFVLFNGGPGVSSGLLLGLGTGRSSFAPIHTGPDATLADNPSSWTALGNLLWIDARNTGFSHGLLDDPSDDAARSEAMSVASFNSYRDGADFVLTLLAVLAAHPELRDNPIVLVAESYGGTRAQIMLDMLLQPEAYADGSRRLRDDALVEAILDHHGAAVGGYVGPASAAAQFGRQVLIQPALTGRVQEFQAGDLFELPGSAVEVFAGELGVEYPSCAMQGGPCDPYQNALDFVSGQGRSPYDTRAELAWLDQLLDLGRDRLNDAATTDALLGLEATSIPGFAASERPQAWRASNLAGFPADAALGDWPVHAGALEAWDRYFAVFHHEALARFRGFTARSLELDPADPHFGELLLSNLVWVDTLITDAAYDLVIYTPAIAPALAAYPELVDEVSVDEDAREWTVVYAPGAFPEFGPALDDDPARVIAVPRYEASHAVTLDTPAQLRDDLELWL